MATAPAIDQTPPAAVVAQWSKSASIADNAATRKRIADALIADGVDRHADLAAQMATYPAFRQATTVLKKLCDETGVPFWAAATLPTEYYGIGLQKSPIVFNREYKLSADRAPQMQAARIEWAAARDNVVDLLARNIQTNDRLLRQGAAVGALGVFTRNEEGELEKNGPSLNVRLESDAAAILSRRIAEKLVLNAAAGIAGKPLPVMPKPALAPVLPKKPMRKEREHQEKFPLRDERQVYEKPDLADLADEGGGRRKPRLRGEERRPVEIRRERPETERRPVEIRRPAPIPVGGIRAVLPLKTVQPAVAPLRPTAIAPVKMPEFRLIKK